MCMVLQARQQPCSVQVQKLFAGNFTSADAFRKHAAHLAQVHSASWAWCLGQCVWHATVAAALQHAENTGPTICVCSLASMRAVVKQMSISRRAWSGQLMMTTAQGC